MSKAIRIHEHGGPEVMRFEDVEVGAPGQGEARLRHTAVGLNFIDIYQRQGLYPLSGFPLVLGMEGAGVVEEIGPGVSEAAVGQRVAYVQPIGSYAEQRLIPADRLVVLPDDIDDRQAAAMMLQGMTAEYLIRRTYAVQAGDWVLFHAAAGGVGQIACQWLKHLGATVIGTVGTDAKAEQARAAGCDHPIVYTRENFTERVREITGGEGVPVVYDAVGKDTFEGSLDCLRPRGVMVSFGNASGPVEQMAPAILGANGSLYLTRPSLLHYNASRHDLLDSAAALFDVVRAGHVKLSINQEYALADAARAHEDLAARKTTGSTVLMP